MFIYIYIELYIYVYIGQLSLFKYYMLLHFLCLFLVARVGPDSDFFLSGIRPDDCYFENRISGIRPDTAFLFLSYFN